ncbi:MAG TPA: DUF3710 domain-containing protein [Propionicimonas sp.]|nr:DUF3710 domain-containing protein [Propionicimonas sp.]HQA76899.1 DUF3710 domain-containing protein [Propionicimonas sp.]HQD97359.1 DUF3710 domain-containing protein [Propionicimonas sp.]
MIFGRKRKPADIDPVDTEEEALEIVGEDADDPADDEVEATETDELEDDDIESGDEDFAADDLGEEIDWRADGPFDSEEVELGGDGVTRIDLGSVVITPWPGIGLQLQVNEATKQVQAATAVWKNSGLEIVLFAAPASGGLAAELREDAVEEAEQAGGSATLATGPFGAEVRRVLPQEGPGGEQMFHVSRVWFAEGPRWLLRGTLLGEAAIGEADAPVVAPFVELFRNLVVRRGTSPMVPGMLMPMQLPEGPEEG